MSKNDSRKSLMNLDNSTTNVPTGSSLWSSTSDTWVKFDFGSVNIDQTLSSAISTIKNETTEVKNRIAAFETPVHPDLLTKIIS